METTDNSSVKDAKKEVKAVDSNKEAKRRIKFTRITKEELERRRIPVYSYII